MPPVTPDDARRVHDFEQGIAATRRLGQYAGAYFLGLVESGVGGIVAVALATAHVRDVIRNATTEGGGDA